MAKSSKKPYNLMILGWLIYSWILSYLINCYVISSYLSSFFSIIFNANRLLELFYLAKNTWPYLPAPNSLTLSKWFSVNIFIYCFMEERDCLTHVSVVKSILLLRIIIRYLYSDVNVGNFSLDFILLILISLSGKLFLC